MSKTAFAVAMEKAGVETARARLYTLATTILGSVQRPHAGAGLAKFTGALRNDPELIIELIGQSAFRNAAFEYLRQRVQEMTFAPVRDGAHLKSEPQAKPGTDKSGSDGGQTRNDARLSDAASLPETNAFVGNTGQKMSDTQYAFARPTKAPDKTQRAANLSGALKIQASLLSTYRVRDGRALGSLRWHELPKLASENTREAHFLNLIYRSRAPSTDGFAKLSVIMGESELQRFLQKAAELQDDAA